MANCTGGDFSQLPWIAESFHSFAHVNFYFHNVSSVFVPTLQDYQQALFLYALGPCLFGGLVFLIFCGHFLASWCSCDKHHRPQAKCVMALQCIVLLTSVLCSGVIIAGFVFNDKIDKGVNGVLDGVEHVNDSLLEIQTKVDSVKDGLIDMDSTLLDAKSDCSGNFRIEESIDKVRLKIEGIVTSLARIKKVNLPAISEYIHDIEYYRWWATFGTMCLNLLAFLLMIYAILRRSRCGFVLAILVGIICLLVIWCGAGVDLAMAVGMSDLCVNPKGTIHYYIKSQLVLKNTGVVRYYMDCPLDEHNPYQKYADKAKEYLEEVISPFYNLINMTHDIRACKKDPLEGDSYLTLMYKSQESVSIIAKNLDCRYAHKQFQCSQCYVCYYIAEGIAELLLMTLIIGFFLIINLTLVLPILLRTPPSKIRKHRSILRMCGSDSPLGTPYQSISEEDTRTESVALITSDMRLPTYNAMHRSSMEFHSFEDSWKPGRFSSVGANPLLTSASPPSSSTAASNTDPPNIRGRGEINSMAF